MIELLHISKKYGDKSILDNINLSFEEGKFIAIKGESGCGKTTLFNIVGLLDNYEGIIKIDNQAINKKNRENIRKNNLSYVFQDFLLLEYLTSYENVILPLKNLGMNIDKDRFFSLFKKLNIAHLIDKKISLLSGGERTRVSIIRAIISNPKYILADEPIGNLDEDNATNIMQIFKSLSTEGIGIIMVTHNNNYDSYYDNIYQIKDRKIYEIK